MFKSGKVLIILSIILLIFSMKGFTYYEYTQESGDNFFVNVSDKSDALEDTNEIRQIIDDLGNLLGHSKRDDSYPKDLTTGGTLSITPITITIDHTNTLAAGLKCFSLDVIQGTNALTGTLRGAYITASNYNVEATGTIRGLEVKARTEQPGGSGATVAVLEGISISADSKDHSIGIMRGIEVILDGTTGGTVTEGVGIRIANNMQADKITTMTALQIYADSFPYDFGIDMSKGAGGIDTDIKLSKGETIINNPDGTIALSAAILTTSAGTVRTSANKLSAFAATTSAELAGVISDETGSGLLVFGTNPSFYNPIVGTHDGASVLYIERYSVGYPDAAIIAGRIDNNVGVGLIFYYRDSSGAQTLGFNLITDGSFGIGTSLPSGNLDVNAVTNADAHILLSENNATKWDFYNDNADDNLQVKSGATLRYEFGTDGTANADVAWGTFSPDVKGEGKELLAIALEDANKSVKPYDGIPVVKTDDELFDMIPTEYEVKMPVLDDEGNQSTDSFGKPLFETVIRVKDEKVFRSRKDNEFATEAEKQVEYDKYHKVPAKISIANAKYLEYLTGIIDEMQTKIEELEKKN